MITHRYPANALHAYAEVVGHDIMPDSENLTEQSYR